MFLFFGALCFNFFISCGEENFDPFKDEGYDKRKGMLPTEITQVINNNINGVPSTLHTEFEYDLKDRITSIKSSTGSSQLTHTITYNENNGTVNQLIVVTPTGTYTYSYEYTDRYHILEHVALNGKEQKINTLTINAQSLLLKKEDPEEGITTYGYDLNGNVIRSGVKNYFYDTSKGSMSAVKTPYWLYFTLENTVLFFPFNLVNNIDEDDQNSLYDYLEFNEFNYPTRVNVNTGAETITITYKLSTLFNK